MDIQREIDTLSATDLVLFDVIGALITSLDSPELRAKIAENLNATSAMLLQSQNEQKLQMFLDLHQLLLEQWKMR